MFDPDTAQINCIPTEKCTQQQQYTRGSIILNKIVEYLLRGLGNNQIKELPPGVFNNNNELIKL